MRNGDPTRQYGIHINVALTIQTRRRYTSALLKNTEELRAKYDVLSNCWLLSQQRQPGSALHADVDSTTFPQILKELLGKKNFALEKELDGKPLVAPLWSPCLSYELSCTERHTRSVVSRTWDSAQLGGKHTETRSTVCRTGCSWSVWPTAYLSPKSVDRKYCAEGGCGTTPEQRCRQEQDAQGMESRNGGRGNKKLQLTGPQQLALPGPSAPKANPKSKGKARGKGHDLAARRTPFATLFKQVLANRTRARRHVCLE